jgi:propanol-preferring alcohol dehydrogenase
VRCCGVCRTDLHIIEGDLPPRHPGIVPGHEVVGMVDAMGNGAGRFAMGDRVGLPWLAWTCGKCRFCTSGRENLCLLPRFTGYDQDGGYADHAVIHERYAYRIPQSFTDEQAAPLLCAGIIGYRAYRKAQLRPGGRLGIYGFGGSAHIAAQVAKAEGAKVYVMTRSARARELALQLGADYAGEPGRPPSEPLDAAILFAPDGRLVPVALEALDRGATLAVAGIHLSRIPQLDYGRHLFNERRVTSVTANTRADGEELLALAERIPIHVETTPFSLDEADRAVRSLAEGKVTGAAVLLTG